MTHLNCDIRRGRLADAEQLAILATQVWLHTYATSGITTDIAQYVLGEITPKKYQALLNDTTYRVFVAVSGESLIGLAVVKLGIPCPTDNTSFAELETLYIQEHFHGYGIGKQLLQTAEVDTKQQLNSKLWLTVNTQNTNALAFYAHLGYTQIGTTYLNLGTEQHENQILIGSDAL